MKELPLINILFYQLLLFNFRLVLNKGNSDAKGKSRNSCIRKDN